MKDVGRKEILKWLDAGIIYPISDSEWASPVPCVPKKGGITVISNEKNELIPTRTKNAIRLCNAPATFQRCMTAIFSDLNEDCLEIVMDDFSTIREDFDNCLSNLEKVLIRCKETNLVLNWEKCHFMVDEGIVLGHKISSKGMELVSAPIVEPPDWTLPFELMCDASDYAVGAILGEQKGKIFHPIYYASKTLNDVQVNYTTTKKELLAVIFAFDKFRSYLIGAKNSMWKS
ncbi:hypothetical protein GQ457_02G010690 [Hibiscus cannabinus]